MKTKIFNITFCLAGMLFGLLGGLNAEVIDTSNLKTVTVGNTSPNFITVRFNAPNGNEITWAEVPKGEHREVESDSDQFMVKDGTISLETKFYKPVTFTLQGTFPQEFKQVYLGEGEEGEKGAYGFFNILIFQQQPGVYGVHISREHTDLK